MKNSVLGILGLAQKAGKLITGEPLVLKSIYNNQAKLIFLASDAGQSIQKKIHDKCRYYSIPLFINFTRTELSVSIGKVRSIVAITDLGFSQKLISLLSD